jgi:hypothetical protein
MTKESQIIISGVEIPLTGRSSDQLEGINIGEKLSFDFYDGTFKGVDILFIKPKGKNPSPRKCGLIAERMSQLFRQPIVFILSPGPTYERQRLMDKGVYFAMSDKYANLPMFVALERVTSRKKPEKLTPVAQYLLLYHLQIESIEGKSTKAIASLMPYSYESVSLGLTCLTDIGLCEKVAIDWRTRSIKFNSEGRRLWEQAGKYLVNPVERRYFCDGLTATGAFPVCGINALAHYSMLNPDPEHWIMMNAKEYRDFSRGGKIIKPNEFDGEIIIEIWKYPIVTRLNSFPEWVDKLSLALSLRADEDPRVEEEVEQMIENFQW